MSSSTAGRTAVDAAAPPAGRLRDYVRVLRPLQWVKNLLVFAPLAAAHETRPEIYLTAAGVFAALSACASGTYVLNDLVDLPYDRRHGTKRRRPLAAGVVQARPVSLVAAVLVAGSLAAAFRLSAAAGLCVLLYLAATVAYSLALKRRSFIDVVTLAGLLTIRVVAGGATASIALSPWFLGFCMFLFLALAIVKRQRELYAMVEAGRDTAAGRAYCKEDLPVLAALATASGFASVVVLALYISSPAVNDLYARPEFLWLICLLLIYWLGRLMLLAGRGTIDDDPVAFTVRDRASWLTAVGIAAGFTAAL